MLNSTSSPSWSALPSNGSYSLKWKNISRTTSARSRKPNESFIDDTTPRKRSLETAVGLMLVAHITPLHTHICTKLWRLQLQLTYKWPNYITAVAYIVPSCSASYKSNQIAFLHTATWFHSFRKINEKEMFAIVFITHAAKTLLHHTRAHSCQ